MDNRTQNNNNGLAIASLICGIFGCIFMCSVVFGIFFGALAIFFALLARGDSYKITRQSRAGFILGIISIICAIIILAISIHNIITTYGSLEGFLNEIYQIISQSVL